MRYDYTRAPAENPLQAPSASNKTLAQYRDKVAGYLASDTFQARLEELQSGVSAVCVSGATACHERRVRCGLAGWNHVSE